MIESVPNYKMFCLTGKKGQNSYLNQVDVMDCGSMVWNTPAAIGEPPIAREDTAMAYDPKTCKVLLFGGWSNRWLGDTWTLNVSPIIGPPYAVFNVTPDIGPVFGETEVTIHGMQFKEAEKIEVCFKTGKNEVISKGTFVDSTKITCLTPNFEDFGAVEVEVRLNINNEGWTVNKMRFRYFANTSAKNCLAFGPGLNPATAAKYGVEIPFLILAKDTCNAKRTSGGDEFIVEVSKEGDPRARPRGLSALWTRTTASTRCTTRSPLRGGIASTSDMTISASRKRSFPSADLRSSWTSRTPGRISACPGRRRSSASGARSHRFLRRRWRSGVAAMTRLACSTRNRTVGPGKPRTRPASQRLARTTARLALRAR